MTLLQVGSCDSALLHGTFVGGDGHVSFVEEFAFHTHTIFVFFGICGCGVTPCDLFVFAPFLCLGNHI